MPLGTLDRSPPPFFKQGPSALSKLMVCSALALLLMVADVRFSITQPLRAAISTALYPLHWVVLQPVLALRHAGGFLQSHASAQAAEGQARQQLAAQAQRTLQVEQLEQENARLRQLLELRTRLAAPAAAAQVLYDAADPYTRKVIIDKGRTQGVKAGSPVIDESGVLGQVTRVHAMISEVTLVTDPDQAVPVLNLRTSVRSVVFGDPAGLHGGTLELKFLPPSADIEIGDLLTTSGVDGVYPPGLPVARVTHVDRRSDSAFARVHASPMAAAHGARHVMVLEPVGAQLPPRPAAQETPAERKGGRR